MENERMEWSPLEQLIRALFWESKKFFYKLRLPACCLLGTAAVLWALPQEACDFLRSHVWIAVMVLNTCLGLSLFGGILFLPEVMISAPFSDKMYPMERLGNLSVKARLAARLLIVTALMAALILTGGFASGVMGKFATNTSSLFRIELAWGFWKTLVINGLTQPLIFLWFFLRRLRAGRGRQYVLSYFFSMLFTYAAIAVAELKFLHFAPGSQPPAWVCEGVWYLVMLGCAGVFFFLCAGEEEKTQWMLHTP